MTSSAAPASWGCSGVATRRAERHKRSIAPAHRAHAAQARTLRTTHAAHTTHTARGTQHYKIRCRSRSDSRTQRARASCTAPRRRPTLWQAPLQLYAPAARRALLSLSRHLCHPGPVCSAASERLPPRPAAWTRVGRCALRRARSCRALACRGAALVGCSLGAERGRPSHSTQQPSEPFFAFHIHVQHEPYS